MKKITTVIATVIAMGIFLTACASNKGIAQGAKQADEIGNPKWAQVSGASVTFKEKQASIYEAVETGEKGLYASGYSESLGNRRLTASSADLSARTELGRYVGTQMVAARNRMTGTDRAKADMVQLDADRVNSMLIGSRAVDSYVNEAGEVWVLMFISNADIANSFQGTDLESIANFLLSEFDEENN